MPTRRPPSLLERLPVCARRGRDGRGGQLAGRVAGVTALLGNSLGHELPFIRGTQGLRRRPPRGPLAVLHETLASLVPPPHESATRGKRAPHPQPRENRQEREDVGDRK